MQFNKFELDQSQNNHIIEAAAAAEIQSLNMIKCGAINLTTIGDPWYFDRAVVFQRLINQSFYQEILLLPKFNDID